MFKAKEQGADGAACQACDESCKSAVALAL